jgi:D-alanyl-lipoteichoic acid acyltransferase DltB (MBOAT superfamily)
MLFNSPEFIFLFLPVVVLLHFTLAAWSVNAAVVATTISSLVFYAWWNPPFVALPVVSILANFWIARRMTAAKPDAARYLLIAGVAANLALLCYFKYSNFLLSIIDGRKNIPPNVPLALSFTTFVQIAFLVHVYKRRPTVDFSRYALFVAFFPHLIAGPIVRWNSLGPQLADRARYRVDWNNVALGLTIFTFGLAKKVLLADSLAPHVAPVFDAAARGEAVTALAAWGASCAFIVQVFFDFSGYSEMAVGIGLLFNFRLPMNFAAPLRAPNMFDLWRRWHITLSRFFRDFVYIPLSLRHSGTLRHAINLLLTMVVAGLWHGANWTFVIWGAYLGVVLLINQAWRALRGPGRPTAAGRFLGWLMTFIAFVFGGAFFRGADIGASWHLIKAMGGFGGTTQLAGLAVAPGSSDLSQGSAGLGDTTLVANIVRDWDLWAVQHGYVTEQFLRAWFGNTWSIAATFSTLVALAIVLFVPDTMEIVGYREGEAHSNWRRSFLTWRITPAWLAAMVALFAAAFLVIGRVSEFYYYQF